MTPELRAEIVALVTELLEQERAKEEKRILDRERQRKCRSKKKVVSRDVTHVSQPVTFSPLVVSRSVTLGHKNGSSPSSSPPSPQSPLSPPLTPPTPKKSSSYATRQRVQEWCARKKFMVMLDFAWGKIRLHERFNPPITNEADFKAEMFNIKSMWLKEKE